MNERLNPVVVGLSGGLGNQMFQYAAGRSLAMRLNTPLSLDLSWFAGQKERRFALSSYGIEANLVTQYPWLGSRLQAQVTRASRRFMPRLFGVPVFREPHFHYEPRFQSLDQPVFLEGYWQSNRYFQEIRQVLLEEFALKAGLPFASAKILEKITSVDSICVHVRRGDYLSNPVAARTHGVCSLDYYKSGIAELARELSAPHCFVFSDDIAWVKESLATDCPMTVVDVNASEDAHLDLTLMAACNHFLIANSSLSWWGAWLGQSNNKRVVAPARWFMKTEIDTSDLIPASWHRL